MESLQEKRRSLTFSQRGEYRLNDQHASRRLIFQCLALVGLSGGHLCKAIRSILITRFSMRSDELLAKSVLTRWPIK